MSYRIAAALIAGTLAIAFAGCGGGGGSPAPPGPVTPSTRTIAGKVVAKDINNAAGDARPVQGVTVQLQVNGEWKPAVTGTDGILRLEVSATAELGPAFQVLVTGATGSFPPEYNQLVTCNSGQTYTPALIDVPKAVLNGQSNDLGTIQINEGIVTDETSPPPAPFPYHDTIIYGRVVKSGNGLAGVKVTFGGSTLTTASDTTGQNGYFAINLRNDPISDYYSNLSEDAVHFFAIDTLGAGTPSNTPVNYNGKSPAQSSIEMAVNNWKDVYNGQSTDLLTISVVDASKRVQVKGRLVSASGQGIPGYWVYFGANDEVSAQTDSTGAFLLVLDENKTVADLYPPPKAEVFKIYRRKYNPDEPPDFPFYVQLGGLTYYNTIITVPSEIINGTGPILDLDKIIVDESAFPSA